MKVLHNINDYRNLNFRDDPPVDEVLIDMKNYWDELNQEPKFKQYLDVAPLLHDAKIISVKEEGGNVIITFREYYGEDRTFTLKFLGVDDMRTYKTNIKGKLTKKKTDFDIFGYDSLSLNNDKIQYVFLYWQKDWRRQRSHNVCMICCDEIESKIFCK